MFEVLISYITNLTTFIRQLVDMIQKFVQNQRDENNGITTSAE